MDAAPPISSDAADPGAMDDPSGDAAPTTLLVDDFADGDVASNTIGAPVSSEQQTLTPGNGELGFVWNGVGTSQGLIESLLPRSCPTDLRGYRVLRFRMRASAPGKVVQILLGSGNPDCSRAATVSAGTINPSPTMTTYTVNLSSVSREAASFLQWSPPLDSTVYTIDDIELVR